MKFNCKKLKTREALMKQAREVIKRSHIKAKELRKWKKKFAWFPVVVDDGDCRWLEWVERCYPRASGIDESLPRWRCIYTITDDNEIIFFSRSRRGFPEYRVIENE